jgi:hypothetical protein
VSHPLPLLKRQHHLLLAVLSSHIGAAQGLSAKELTNSVNRVAGMDLISERELRHLVTDLRMRGHHVCATPESGYFMAANDKELLITCRFLFDRGMTGLRQVAAMRKVALPDLAGQLRIPLEPQSD